MLRSYGSLSPDMISKLSNVTEVSPNGIVYLSSLNVVNNTVVTAYYDCTLDELTFLQVMSKIYTNGGSEIYKNRP